MIYLEDLLRGISDREYNFGTGVWPVLNENLKIRLNKYGEYEYYSTKEYSQFSKEESEKILELKNILDTNNVDLISKELFSKIPEMKFNSQLGYYLNLYAGYVVEGDYRANASSGGFGTWLLKELFEKKLVDGIIHVTESKDSSKLFEYSISKSIKEIENGAKTKYYPVELSEVLQLVKKNPGRYAVIGLPSFVMSIRLLSKIDPVINERIVFILGLVCGHQKSTFFGDFLAWQCGIKPGKLKKIDFRKKLDHGLASSYAIEVTGEIEGQEVTIVKEMKDLFGSDWGQGLFKIRASDFTDDVMNEAADVTLGDAWLPEYTTDNKGNNILIVRNPVIQDIINKGIKNDMIKLDILNEEMMIRSQSSHFTHTSEELGYRLYKKNSKKEWKPKTRIEASKNYSFYRKRVQDLREIIAKKAPVYYVEAVKRDDIDYFFKKMKPITLSYKVVYKFIGLNKKIKKLFFK